MAPAPATDAEDGGGGGTRNWSSMVVVKTKAVCMNGGALVVAPDLAEDQGCDTSECSSSFGDTSYEFEDEADWGEPEVNSVISARANGGGSSKLLRKKVTAEWSNSIRPILWRCQWLELRMKELSSQVSMYDRELALIKKEQELQQAIGNANDFISESMQIHKGHTDSIMKRRKRKRHEENVDASLYINRHHIMSYYHDTQNKGAETGDLLIDDDCGSTVDGSIKGGLDPVTLLNSESYNIIFEQLTLKGTLVTIDGLQSRVHLLQDCLSKVKVHSGGENLALSEDNTHVRVPPKRQRTQKRSLSYTKCRYTKPQKYVNILLQDDNGSALAWRAALPVRETDTHIKDANRNAEERNGECNHPRGEFVTIDLLLDKQNKRAETGGLLIDDDCGSTVDGSIRGGLDPVTLLNSESYNIIFEQLILKGTLMAIDGLQSRVHLLQDCLSKVKVHSGGENLALSEENTHVTVPRKRQHTQKRSFRYTKCRYTKSQKMKYLNILLKDDDGSALAGKPALSVRETDTHIKDANRNAEERNGECNHSRGKFIRIDLLLGTNNSLPNGHIGDPCKENTDDILIDSQAANEACRQFDKARHLPSGTSSKGPSETKNISAPAEAKNTCAPVETTSTSAVAVELVSPQSKDKLKPKKKRKKGSFFTKKKRKKANKTPATKEKTEGKPSAAKNKTGSTTYAVAVEKTESVSSGATGPGTMAACSAGKKRKTRNECADVKKRESAALKKQETGKPSSAAKKQKTENPSSAAKKQKTENPSSAAKKQKTENPSSARKQQEAENALSATKETESAPLNLKIENAVPVDVNSRRSQRVRKLKVFAD